MKIRLQATAQLLISNHGQMVATSYHDRLDGNLLCRLNFKDTSDLQCVGLGLKADSGRAFTWSFHWTSK